MDKIKNSKIAKIILAILAVLVVVAIVVIVVIPKGDDKPNETPTVAETTTEKQKTTEKPTHVTEKFDDKGFYFESDEPVRGEEFYVYVKLYNFDGTYNGISLDIQYDQEKLEILSIEQGNLAPEKEGANNIVWDSNLEESKEDGNLKLMYLDTTLGEFSLSGGGESKDAILLKLKVKIFDSIREGRSVFFSLNNAMFIAADDSVLVDIKDFEVVNGNFKTVVK